MKKFPVLTIVLFFAASLSAQDSWRVVLHKKLLLTGKEENQEKNVRLIKSADWKKSGYLEINYKEVQPSSWRHSIRFADEQENELLVKDSVTSARVLTTSLRKIFAGKRQVKIYMIIAPTDPMIMAPARRIHLVTLKLP